ncbi:beta carbonic anhydrase 5, chloroplastic isoform X1 [Ziziphus jujuba]|uniref:Carbonic anhydrase n=1 Tax=Ziziphus jujuba TaxID=326968 RepID=A0A6P3ZW85_ZIZJJ|nr:beta carbonic anhydrase 5, chloroplastic isoform X1 [Ziziphus jujuba]
MVWRIRSKARWIVPSMASLRPPSISKDSFHCPPLSGFTSSLVGLPKRSLACSDPKNQLIYSAEAGENHSGLLPSVERNLTLRLEASGASSAQDCTNIKAENVYDGNSRVDLFGEMKMRFLSFKKHKYLEEREHFRTLAEAQAPKLSCVLNLQVQEQFMVIACADSRVCPSNILGFQPGEAFIIRNVANLVPPLENGPSETNAALEFAVNTLQVENILVIGHSRCGGIETLMSMQDDDNSSFIHSWIIKAKTAKLRAKAAVPHLNFEQQCRHCERESINNSLMNLLTYPWIEERAKKDMLSIHGGYYDFLNCTFEKWDLDAKNSNVTEKGARYLVKDTMYWY